MDIHAVMLNILIGVGSGIVSSIIVAVASNEIGKLSTEFEEALKMTRPLLYLSYLSKCMNNKNSELIKEEAEKTFLEAKKNFNRFEDMHFSKKLKSIMSTIYLCVMHTDTLEDIKAGRIKAVSDTFLKEIKKIDKLRSEFIKTVFQNIVSKKVIIIQLMLFLLAIFIA